MIVVTMPETYSYGTYQSYQKFWKVFIVDYRPIILVYKARKLRQTTGDSRYYAALERNVPHPRQIVNKVLARPFQVLFNEPMLMAMTAYLSVGPLFFRSEFI